jgi:prepilin-type N-terminal cleavage/methylation domain-containing protein
MMKRTGSKRSASTNAAAFTLIELLVVIGIIAILACHALACTEQGQRKG